MTPNPTAPLTIAGAAHEYVSGLGFSVIPLLPPTGESPHHDGKHPAVSGWSAYQGENGRRATPDELALWFDGTQNNVAIIAGQVSGGLAVIDCDDPVTYASLVYAYPDLGASLTVETGKGYHIYTRASVPVATVKFTANGLAHHVKAEGGYVVAPPSVHQSGRVYRWRDPAAPILDLDPERLAVALRRVGATRAGDGPQSTGHERGWAAELLRNGARMGERDEATFQLAAYLLHFLPYDTTEAILEAWAAKCDQRPNDPWGPSEVGAKLRSAHRYQD